MILIEIFENEQNIVEHESKHWIEWIWGLFWIFSIEIVCNGCLFATVAYEKFGMDPQKRTVINQLLSHCCWITMMFNITTFPILVGARLSCMVVPVVEFKTDKKSFH